MINYIIRRVFQAIPLILFISIVIFALLQITPGGPLARFENDPTITAEDLQNIRDRLGLDDPIPVQYGRWLGLIVQGDLGTSYITNQPVLEMIQERLPNTLKLMVTAFTVTILLAIPIGILSAVKQYSLFDHFVTSLAFAGQSIPIFWFGLVLILVFYVALDNPWTGEPLFPSGGIYSLDKQGDFIDGLWHMVLPVTMLSLAWMSWYTRFLRSSMLDVLHQDYVRTARAKGLRERLVLLRHGFPNAIIPMITLIALDLPTLFSGAVFTETIFSWPGMGRLFFQSALRRDYPVLMAIVMFTAVLIVFSNLLADILYALLDPRIRYD
jgi:peptide/nickel transport system permease protein